jgi:hypothetical protein
MRKKGENASNVRAKAAIQPDQIMISPLVSKVNPPLKVTNRVLSVIAFHEKDGRSQVGYSFLLDKFLFFCAEPPTVATLPSALFAERLLNRSVQVGCSRFSRCCHLIVDLGSISRMEVGPGD